MSDLVSPWHPITDPRILKTLGKLSEELGECSAVVARCIIQGVGESHPLTGKRNVVWLEEEIADVLANLRLVRERLNLDDFAIHERARVKYELLLAWHEGA